MCDDDWAGGVVSDDRKVRIVGFLCVSLVRVCVITRALPLFPTFTVLSPRNLRKFEIFRTEITCSPSQSFVPFKYLYSSLVRSGPGAYLNVRPAAGWQLVIVGTV
jgi:hypothetical protein